MRRSATDKTIENCQANYLRQKTGPKACANCFLPGITAKIFTLEPGLQGLGAGPLSGRP